MMDFLSLAKQHWGFVYREPFEVNLEFRAHSTLVFEPTRLWTLRVYRRYPGGHTGWAVL